jgi:hypothetical protein
MKSLGGKNQYRHRPTVRVATLAGSKWATGELLVKKVCTQGSVANGSILFGNVLYKKHEFYL